MGIKITTIIPEMCECGRLHKDLKKICGKPIPKVYCGELPDYPRNLKSTQYPEG